MSIKLGNSTFNNGGTANFNNGTSYSLNEIRFSGYTVWKKETPISTVLKANGSGGVGTGASGSAELTSSESWDLRGSNSVKFTFTNGGSNIPAGMYWQAYSVYYEEFLVFKDGSTIRFAYGDYGNGTQPSDGTYTVDISGKSEDNKSVVKFKQYYSWSSNGQNTGAAWYMSAQLSNCIKI